MMTEAEYIVFCLKVDEFTKPWADMGATLLYDASDLWGVVEPQIASKKPKGLSEVEEYTRQAPRRNYVRAVFAFVEGVSFMMLDFAPFCDDRLSEATHRPLILRTEERTQMKSDQKRGFTERVKFGFGQMKRFTYDYPLDFNCAGWNKLVRSVSVRDRLTHPKKHSDLLVSDIELKDVRAACEWFEKLFDGILNATHDYYHKEVYSVHNREGNKLKYR